MRARRRASRSKRAAFASVLALSLAVGVLWCGAADYARPRAAGPRFAENFDLVGYHDLDGRPAFKLALQVVANRWYLYTAHFWDRGWSVLDVTEPSEPKLLAFVPGPANTATLQVQVADGLMLTSLEKPPTELLRHAPWQGLAWLLRDSLLHGPKYVPWRSSPAGLLLWNVQDPARPTLLGSWESGGTGTHRNFYAGGRHAHLAANKRGFRGHQYVILDLADPAHPVEVGHWFLPEQEIASGVAPEREGYYLHGPAHVIGDRAYLPYGVGGAIVLDISDLRNPREIGRLRLDASLGSTQGVHSFVPVPERRIAIVNSEAHDEECRPDPGRSYAAVVDLGAPHPLVLPGAGASAGRSVSELLRARRPHRPAQPAPRQWASPSLPFRPSRLRRALQRRAPALRHLRSLPRARGGVLPATRSRAPLRCVSDQAGGPDRRRDRRCAGLRLPVRQESRTLRGPSEDTMKGSSLRLRWLLGLAALVCPGSCSSDPNEPQEGLFRWSISTAVEIDAPAARVWEVLVDLSAYPEWNPFIVEAEGKVAVGEILSLRMALPGREPMTIEPRLLVVEPERELRWKGRILIPGLFDGEHAFVFTPLENGRTRLDHSERFAGLLLPFAKSMIYDATVQSFHALDAALAKRAASSLTAVGAADPSGR